jgi:hypothetical protein
MVQYWLADGKLSLRRPFSLQQASGTISFTAEKTGWGTGFANDCGRKLAHQSSEWSRTRQVSQYGEAHARNSRVGCFQSLLARFR